MSAAIKFSIIVPVFNICRIESEFRRCLLSIQEQTYGGWELIFVNDASTDASAAILAEAAAAEPRIRIVHHKSNRRQGAARNTGTPLAQGQYLLYCDQDDFLYPDALQAAADLIEEHGRPDVIDFKCEYVGIEEFDHRKIVAGKSGRLLKPGARRIEGEEILRMFLSGNLAITSWSRVIETGLAKQIVFPEQLPEDVPHSLGLFAQASSLVHSSRPFYTQVIHSQSDGSTYSMKTMLYDYIRCFTGSIQAQLEEHRTAARMPRAHETCCLGWILACTTLMGKFTHSDEDVLAWGRMVDTVGLPGKRVVRRQLWRGLLEMNFWGTRRRCRKMRRIYRKYQRLLAESAAGKAGPH